MRMPYKKRQIIQVGVNRTSDCLQFVWLNPAQQVQFLSLSADDSAIERTLMQRLTEDFSQTALQWRLVGCISPHLTWSKSLVLPHVLNTQECEQQCRFVLQKELPIPLEALWFDFTSTPLKQGFRLDVHAVRREVASERQQAFMPFPLDVLDVMHHAILRAFHFLLDEDRDNSLYLYQDEHHCFALMTSAHQSQFLQTTENLTALYEQFCQRFEPNIAQVYVYQTPESQQQDLPKDWLRIDTDFPFIALGNALWQQDLWQENLVRDFTALSASKNKEAHHAGR